MPSGARKRKAAKKKKILEANNNNANSHDNDDSKSQSDKGSDGSEVSSPATQDHYNTNTTNNNNNPFNKGNTSGVRSIAPKNTNSMEKAEDDPKVIEIEWSLKPEKDDGDRSSESSQSSSRSNSSSDDESKKPEKDKAPVIEKSEDPGNDNLVSQLTPVIESVMPGAPISEETISVVETGLVDNKLVSEVIKSDESPSELSIDSKGYDGKSLPLSYANTARPSNADSKALSSPENQSSVVVHPIQKTPWWSCCGMFDVVSGSR